MVRSNSGIAGWLVCLAASVLLLGCGDARGTGSGDGGLPTGAAAGLYPSVVVTSSGGSSVASLSLVQVPGGIRLGSYQGEITYDARAMEVERTTFPEGVTGAIHQTGPGRLRFVGTALDGIGDVALLRIGFRKKGELSAQSFTAHFEEVTSASDLEDITSSVKNGTLLYRANQ